MTFVRSLSLSQLGDGAGFAVWGFRAIATGHVNCPSLIDGYARAFGDDARPALGGLHMLARAIGHEGGRKVSLAAPGCCRITSDEMSVVALLAAAQARNEAARDAHLRWLTAGRASKAAQRAADAVAMIFQRGDLEIRSPDVTLFAPDGARHKRSWHEAGHA